MKAERYDAIVLGLGGMGSATVYHLARRGRRVLGLEQFTPAHDRGSSHGESRIIRQAYFESPVYVPLLLRAYELWRELERETGRELLRITGGLMIGPPESTIVRGSLESARRYGLAHRLLDATEIRREFPVFHVTTEAGLYEEAAGALFPEECVLAHLDRAAALGAELRFETPVESWRPVDGGVAVVAGGRTVHADRLIVTAGSWAGRMLADLALPLEVERNVVYWFVPGATPVAFAPGRFPIFIWDHPSFPLYGLPDLRGEGVKVGLHHSDQIVDPDRLPRDVGDDEVATVRVRLREQIPALDGRLNRTAVCMYTNTPDEHFVVGLHPRLPRVAIAAGFSGHGFKFSCAIGEVLAELAIDGVTRHPIAPFSPNRFARSVHATTPRRVEKA
jgi:sarcosine oxidase